MKTLAGVVLGIVSVGAAGTAWAQTVLTCTPSAGLLGAPSYRIEFEGAQASLYKVFVNPTARPLLVASSEQIMSYGRTLIFVADLGKSGYVLVYSSETPGKSTAVIDINLLTRRELNTQGPITSYSCTRPARSNREP